eukprot:3221716-Pyramimonas_sp.AAC.1
MMSVVNSKPASWGGRRRATPFTSRTALGPRPHSSECSLITTGAVDSKLASWGGRWATPSASRTAPDRRPQSSE